MKNRKLGGIVAFWIVFLAVVLYLAAKMAMSYDEGISYADFQNGFMETIRKPFVIRAAAQTAAFCMIGAVIWLVLLASYMVSWGKYMQGREHGSADWGSIRGLQKSIRRRKT